MRNVLVVIAVAVLSTTAVFADEIRAGSTNVSAYLSDVGFTHSSSSGDSWSGGGGVAVEHAWTNRITTVLSIGAERRRTFEYHLEPVPGVSPVIVGQYRNVYAYPIDLMARYHFLNESRWTPYLGLGARYVDAPRGNQPAYTVDTNGVYHISSSRPLEDRTSPEVNAGVVFRITPRLGLQLDGKHLLRGDSPSYDPINKVSIGLSWRF